MNGAWAFFPLGYVKTNALADDVFGGVSISFLLIVKPRRFSKKTAKRVDGREGAISWEGPSIIVRTSRAMNSEIRARLQTGPFNAFTQNRGSCSSPNKDRHLDYSSKSSAN